MLHFTRIALALAAPILLASCVITPGKFVSTLRIDADRSFAFTYVGEVHAIDVGNAFAEGMAEGLSEGMTDDPDSDGATFEPIAQEQEEDGAAAKKAETEAKNRAIAEALAKEAGYRKVEYAGDGRFLIDYAIEGRLTHNFIYPFNSEAEVMFPFIAIELKKNGTVRMTAPAFANRSDGGAPAQPDAAAKLDGSFTLSTDAEIVSQNSEDGATTEGTRKSITWRATPLTKAAPMAVLRMGE
ncbi:hypothetical protein D1610_07880 [Sphingomonas gilva]|uniref:Uncharacterized protein n=1 Tax=Sphingomonas gilva TaxID=2305907 RepID=A0A396RPN8_9SPHN|nr:hypothetical protein [Sphingomonas gilva]RHW18369.1 hypothetical protein D1610_07880 [Sphingomonas gilva]